MCILYLSKCVFLDCTTTLSSVPLWISLHMCLHSSELPWSMYTSWQPVRSTVCWGSKVQLPSPSIPSPHRPFSLADLNDYQTHCTVMNYREDAELKNILYDEFVVWNGLFLVDHSESCSVCGWLDAGVEGRQRWVGRSGLSMGCHTCAVHESHVEKRGCLVKCATYDTDSANWKLYAVHIHNSMCVSEWEESPTLQLFPHISITR